MMQPSKGGGTPSGGMSTNMFPSPPSGNIPNNVPFSAFLNSPVGQRVFGGDQTQEISPGSSTQRSFFQTLQDNHNYWEKRQDEMTPAERSRQQFLQGLSISPTQQAPVQPAAFQSGQPSAPLSAFLMALASNRRYR